MTEHTQMPLVGPPMRRGWREIVRFRPLTSAAHVALVVMRRGRLASILPASGPRVLSDYLAWPYDFREVDTHQRLLELDQRLESCDAGYEFGVALRLIYQVTQPGRVALEIDDMPAELTQSVIQSLRFSGRAFGVEQAKAFEEYLVDLLLYGEALAQRTQTLGVALRRADVTVSLDERARAYAEELRFSMRERPLHFQVVVDSLQPDRNFDVHVGGVYRLTERRVQSAPTETTEAAIQIAIGRALRRVGITFAPSDYPDAVKAMTETLRTDALLQSELSVAQVQLLRPTVQIQPDRSMVHVPRPGPLPLPDARPEPAMRRDRHGLRRASRPKALPGPADNVAPWSDRASSSGWALPPASEPPARVTEQAAEAADVPPWSDRASSSGRALPASGEPPARVTEQAAEAADVPPWSDRASSSGRALPAEQPGAAPGDVFYEAAWAGPALAADRALPPPESPLPAYGAMAHDADDTAPWADLVAAADRAQTEVQPPATVPIDQAQDSSVVAPWHSFAADVNTGWSPAEQLPVQGEMTGDVETAAQWEDVAVTGLASAPEHDQSVDDARERPAWSTFSAMTEPDPPVAAPAPRPGEAADVSALQWYSFGDAPASEPPPIVQAPVSGQTVGEPGPALWWEGLAAAASPDLALANETWSATQDLVRDTPAADVLPLEHGDQPSTASAESQSSTLPDLDQPVPLDDMEMDAESEISRRFSFSAGHDEQKPSGAPADSATELLAQMLTTRLDDLTAVPPKPAAGPDLWSADRDDRVRYEPLASGLHDDDIARYQSPAGTRNVFAIAPDKPAAGVSDELIARMVALLHSHGPAWFKMWMLDLKQAPDRLPEILTDVSADPMLISLADDPRCQRALLLALTADPSSPPAFPPIRTAAALARATHGVAPADADEDEVPDWLILRAKWNGNGGGA